MVDQRCFWQRTRWLVVALGMGLFAFGLAELAEGADEAPKKFDYDFRGRSLPTAFKYQVDDDRRFFQREPEGLRLSLPRDRTFLGPVNLHTVFGVRGDFEITATYDILRAEEPDAGWGVGVALRVDKGDPPESATLARLARPMSNQVVFWDRSFFQRKPQFIGGVAPCTDKLIRLRLKRVGTTLYYLWTSGTDEDTFHELHHLEFGAEDLKAVSVTGATGKQERILDARILEFHIRADSLLGLPSSPEMPEAAPQRAESKGWFIALELLGLAIVLALLSALGLWLYARQSRRTARLPAPTALQDTPAETETAAPPVSFVCSMCGKNLRAKAELVGKKVKCSQCGQAVLVPETKVDEAGRISS